MAMHEEKVISLTKIHTDENAADMFTKALCPAKFEHFSKLIRLLKY